MKPSSNGSGIVPMSKPKPERKSNIAPVFLSLCVLPRDIFVHYIPSIHAFIVFMSEFEYLIHKLYLLDFCVFCNCDLQPFCKAVQRSEEINGISLDKSIEHSMRVRDEHGRGGRSEYKM